jgi:hypothetical protein
MTTISSQVFQSISTVANPALLSRAVALINNSNLSSLEPMRVGLSSGNVTVRVATATDTIPAGAHAFYLAGPNSFTGQIIVKAEFLQRASDAQVLQFVDDLRHEYQHHVKVDVRDTLLQNLRTGPGTPEQRGNAYVTGTIDDESTARLASYDFRREVASLSGTDYKTSNFASLENDPLYKKFTQLGLQADQQGLTGQSRTDYLVQNSRGEMASYDGASYRESASTFAALVLQMTPAQAQAFRASIQADIRNAVPFDISSETYDDGSGSVTITYVDGRALTSVYDIDQNLFSRDVDTPDGVGGINRSIDVTVDGKAVHIDQHASAAALADGEQTGDFQGTALTIAGQTAVNPQLALLALDDINALDILLARGSVSQLITFADPANPTGIAAAPSTGGLPWYESDGARQFGSTLTATQSLIASLITGRPLPIATDVFSLAASLSLDPGLGQISQYLSAFNSLSNFAGALERGDSALALTNSGATFVKYALQGVQSVIEGQIAQEFGSLALARSSIDSGNELAADLVGKFDAIDIALKNVLDFLPWVNLFTAIERGDVGATISAALVLAGQPVLAAIVSFISFGISFTQSPPDIHGSAIAISSQDGVHLQSSLTSDSAGGGDVANKAMVGLIAYLEQFVTDADGNSNGLGLIAQRLPQLYFKGYGNSSGYFDLTFKDSQTGQSYTRHYSLEGVFMGEGNGNNPTPSEYNTSKDFFLSMGQQFLKAAEDAGALAPTWMVRTIDAQAARGDVLAGLTTEQRATALGQLLATNPGDATPGNAGGNTNTSTQTFRPLVLDLDGNGITLTTQAQGGNVLLDVDGDGFAEETQWVGPRDGILVLDRDGNGKIEGGHEMFNDSQVNSAARGLHALDEIDANGDGKITSADIAFDKLKVWQDVNHDGRVQGFELVTLVDKTITELNIAANQFVRASGSTGTLVAAL